MKITVYSIFHCNYVEWPRRGVTSPVKAVAVLAPFSCRLPYQLELPAHWKIHNIFHVNVLSEAKPDMIPNCQNLPLPPVKINNKDYYVIEKYINTQWFWNQFQFKI